MSNVNGKIAYTGVPGFPTGAAVDHVSVVLTDQNNAVTKQDVAAGTTDVAFADLADGAYTFAIQAFDAVGASLGAAVEGSFTLSSPSTVTLQLPTSAEFVQVPTTPAAP